MKNRNIICGLLLICLLLTGCSGQNAANISEEPETMAEEETGQADQPPGLMLSVATSGSWRNVSRGILFDKYAERLKDWSGGDIEIRLYDDSVLGDDLQLLEGVCLGTLNMFNCVPSYLTPAVPQAALLDIPTMFDSVEEFNVMMDSGYFAVMQEYFEEKHLKLISCRAYDMRQMTSNVPIHSADDLSGLKLRTMEVEYQVAFWQAMGTVTIPLPFSQVKMALQLGSIQAQENPLYYLESIQLNEVQDYVILTNHLPMISCYVMNLDQWSVLTEQQQELIDRFMTEMNEELIQETAKQNEELLANADRMGLEVIRIDDGLKQALNQAREPLLEMLREKLGDETVDQFLKAVEQAKNSVR